MDDSPRSILAAALTPMLPAAWIVLPSSKTPPRAGKTSVNIRQTQISRHPAAPAGPHAIDMLLTIRAPEADIDNAEDRLDTEITELTHALDQAGIYWADCTKVVLDDQQAIGYDITLTINSTPDSTPR